MTNTTLTLLAAGSLRSAFLPLVARFSAAHWPGGRCAVWPCRPAARADRSGVAVRGFAPTNTAHPQALPQAGLAQESQGFASNQLMLTARRSPDNDGLDWLALLSTTRLRLATSTPGCDPSGDYTWRVVRRLRHAIQGWATRWPGGRSSWSQQLTERARRERSPARGLFARILRICLSAIRTMAPRWPPATICVP